MSCFQEKLLALIALLPVPRTDTRVLGENPQASEITIAKELGKMTSYVRKKRYSQQCESQKRGRGDCLTKTQLSAKAKADV